jgi:hypothetical protein
LLVIAPYYDAYLTGTWLKTYLNTEFQRYRTFNLIFGQFEFGKLAKDQLSDFAVILKSFVIDQNKAKTVMSTFTTMNNPDLFVQTVMDDQSHELYGLFGTVKKAILTCVNGSAFEPDDIDSYEPYQNLLRSVKKELKDTAQTTEIERQSYSMKIFDIESRINSLEMKNYIYYIGADSALQKKILWDQVEDVIKCIRSAVKNGSLPGCQLSIIKATTEIMSDILKSKGDDVSKLTEDDQLSLLILEMIQDAVASVYSTVLMGANGDGILKLIPNWFKYRADIKPDMTEEQIKQAENVVKKQLQQLELDKRLGIIKDSINKNCVFNLETYEFDEHIITSAETDKLVLLASSELVKILISGTQCIYIDAEVNQSEVKLASEY